MPQLHDPSPAPSTYDVPVIAGGQDAVEATLVTALERYRDGGIYGTYVHHGQVCPGGALYVAETGDTEAHHTYVFEWIEERAKKATIKALKLLNEAAVELVPKAARRRKNSYGDREDMPPFGPIEVINEGYDSLGSLSWEERKAIVEAAYELAIATRRARRRVKGVLG